MDVEYRRVSDFEWASAARWLVWFSQRCGLVELNVSQVYSFPVGRMKPDKLIRRKRRLLEVVKSNRAAIERTAEKLKNDLDGDERVLARSVYRQYAEWQRMLEDHLEGAKAWKELVVAQAEKQHKMDFADREVVHVPF